MPTSTGSSKVTSASRSASTTAVARVLAAKLAELGVERGDRVALVSANVPEWVITWWACAVLGAVLVPLNAWWKAEELEFGLVDSGAKVLIADAQRFAMIRRAAPRDPRAAARVRHRRPARPTSPARPFAELVAGAGDPGMPPGFVDEDDLLAILYTSGTTGQPKGATLTHRQAIANLQNIVVSGVAASMRGTPPPEADAALQTATLLVVPLFHVTGCLATMMLNYFVGAKLVLMPVGKFDADMAMQIDPGREDHIDRRRAHDHVAHPRVAEPREVRPVVGASARATAARRPRPSSSSASSRCSRTCARRSRPRTD